jgi:hypothetical protein
VAIGSSISGGYMQRSKITIVLCVADRPGSHHATVQLRRISPRTSTPSVTSDLVGDFDEARTGAPVLVPLKVPGEPRKQLRRHATFSVRARRYLKIAASPDMSARSYRTVVSSSSSPELAHQAEHDPRRSTVR